MRVNKDTRKYQVIVEIQTYHDLHAVQKYLAYWASVYLDTIPEGSPYSSALTVYLLVFTTQNIPNLTQSTDYYTTLSLRSDKSPYPIFTNQMRFVTVELGKFALQRKDLTTRGEEFCYWLKHQAKMTLEELTDTIYSGGNMSNYSIKLSNLANNDEFLRMLLLEEGLRREEELAEKNRKLEAKRKQEKAKAEGKAEGLEEGIEKGIEKTTTNLAMKMLMSGSKIDYVSQITGLSKRALNNLSKEDHP